jgi:hypothetical protein
VSKLTKENKEDILARLAEGEVYQSIANTYNVTRECIRQLASKNKLDGVGLVKRREERYQEWLSKMEKTYGEFFDGSKVNKSDLLTICKEKFRIKKYLAKRKGVEFSVEFKDIKWNEKCPVLGIEIDYFLEKHGDNSPSISKIDPAKGFVAGNTVVISDKAVRLIRGLRTRHKDDRKLNDITSYLMRMVCQVN